MGTSVHKTGWICRGISLNVVEGASRRDSRMTRSNCWGPCAFLQRPFGPASKPWVDVRYYAYARTTNRTKDPDW